MRLLHHGSFIDMESDRDSIVVGDLHKLFDVFNVCAANVGVEENRVTVAILSFYEIIKILMHMFQSLWQTGLLLNRINSEVDRGDSRVGEAIDYIGTKKAGIRCQVNPEIFLSRVVNNL